jgi:Sec-independent protein translocase protein TatA
MFGIGPTELAFFLVIVLLAVGPDKLPTFMRTVGKGVRQVRNASRDFKDAIGLDDIMREGDPFRAPPIRPPRAQPVPVPSKTAPPAPSVEASKSAADTAAPGAPATTTNADSPSASPTASASDATATTDAGDDPAAAADADASTEAKRP